MHPFLAQYGWYIVGLVIISIYLKGKIEEYMRDSRKRAVIERATSREKLEMHKDRQRRIRERQQAELEAAAKERKVETIQKNVKKANNKNVVNTSEYNPLMPHTGSSGSRFKIRTIPKKGMYLQRY